MVNVLLELFLLDKHWDRHRCLALCVPRTHNSHHHHRPPPRRVAFLHQKDVLIFSALLSYLFRNVSNVV